MHTQNQIRAIDVGYGNTKYVSYRNGHSIQCSLFPSLTPRAAGIDLAGDLMRRRDTLRVLVDGLWYEVGPDAVKAQNGREAGRLLKADYCLSSQYRALVYGALASMHVTELDVLVLGLPVSTWNAYRARLAEAYTGEFQVTGELRVKIHRCLVVPQPLGGFYDHAVSAGLFNSMKAEMNMIIDPGYCTLDWLLADGTTTIDARSGAVQNGGMAEVLRDVVALVAQDAQCSVEEVGSVDRIDTALRTGRPLKVFGKELQRDVREYIALAQRKAEDPLRKLLASVGSAGDIDNVILVGGGSHIYADLIRREFPRNNVITVSDSVHANTRGFQIVGEMWFAKQQRATG